MTTNDFTIFTNSKILDKTIESLKEKILCQDENMEWRIYLSPANNNNSNKREFSFIKPTDRQPTPMNAFTYPTIPGQEQPCEKVIRGQAERIDQLVHEVLIEKDIYKSKREQDESRHFEEVKALNTTIKILKKSLARAEEIAKAIDDVKLKENDVKSTKEKLLIDKFNLLRKLKLTELRLQVREIELSTLQCNEGEEDIYNNTADVYNILINGLGIPTSIFNALASVYTASRNVCNTSTNLYNTSTNLYNTPANESNTSSKVYNTSSNAFNTSTNVYNTPANIYNTSTNVSNISANSYNVPTNDCSTSTNERNVSENERCALLSEHYALTNELRSLENEHPTLKNEHRTSTNEYNISANEYNTPTKKYNTPKNEYNTSTNEYNVLTNEYNTPTNEYNTPTNEYNTPTNEHNTPTNEHNIPTNEHNTPTNEHNTPTNEHSIPTNEHNAPTNEHNTPTNEHDAPTNEHNTPANNCIFPVASLSSLADTLLKSTQQSRYRTLISPLLNAANSVEIPPKPIFDSEKQKRPLTDNAHINRKPKAIKLTYRDQWTPNEDKLLLDTVKTQGTDNWEIISKQFSYRSSSECSRRFTEINSSRYSNSQKTVGS